VHAAGVILSREPLVEVLPIQKREQDGAIITQWDMNACESIGCSRWTSSACATSP
jgi:DNA polymerase-3 subunit alpha